MKKKKEYYYQSFDEDIVESNNQDYQIPEDYQWIKKGWLYKLSSSIFYSLAYVFGLIYCRIFLHVRISNTKVLKSYRKQGYFLYGNHTQPIGDVFIPAIVTKKRIYTIADKANLGVTGIGPLLPKIGILPIGNSMSQMKKLWEAVKKRIEEKKCVVIYPEAHVWPYYTNIRPFSDTAFKFPVDCQVPSFCITTTYYQRKYFKKPGIVIYVDGPFVPDNTIQPKEAQQKLWEEISKTMQNRSKHSTYQYINYKERKSS